MEVGVVRIAEDSDFTKLKFLIDNDDDWRLEYSKYDTRVFSKPMKRCDFNMIKIRTVFTDVPPGVMYDVLHDPDYRMVWDTHMMESIDIGCLNINNDVGYYSISCPAPIRNRDFVVQRSWLDTGPEMMIINHSVYHKDYPPRKGFVRAISHITGFVIRSDGYEGCKLGYVTQCDPQGTLPSWLVNKVTNTMAPKLLKGLRKAALEYVAWKDKQVRPDFKPWSNPEQVSCNRISMGDCICECSPPVGVDKNSFKVSTISLPEAIKPKKKKDKHRKGVLSDTD